MTIINARDIKRGDIIEFEGRRVKIESVYWANGDDGEPRIQRADLPRYTKSAVWKKLVFNERTLLVHPAREFEIG
jgi:hypothetical protein